MKLIKNLGTKKDKKGNYQSIALFLCPYCLQEVIKQLGHGLRDKSCGCVQYELSAESLMGKKRTEEQKSNISKGLKGKKHTEEHNKNISEGNKGRIVTEITRLKISEGNKGKIHTDEQNKKNSEFQKERFKNKENHPMYGKQQNLKSRQRISETKIKNGLSKGKNNPMYGKRLELASNWQGGKSFEEYGIEFNKELKQQILERDNYTCQDPNCKIENPKRLHIHHIDYNKKNNNSENLITLCISCHIRTNYNREYFAEFYQNIMMDKLMECFL